MRWLPTIALAAAFGFCTLCEAEFPALEKALSAPVEEVAQQLTGKPVWVCCRNLSGVPAPWSVASAIQVEVVAQLLQKQIDAKDVGNDNVLDKLMSKDEAFGGSDINYVQRVIPDGVFLGVEIQRSGKTPLIVIKLFDIAENRELTKSEAKVDSAAFALDGNMPETNQKVLAFAKQNMNKKVGSGNGWSFVAEALKAAGAKRQGIYHFGRILGPNEAWIPGDILQFEQVEFKKYKSQRHANLSHQSAIVYAVNSPEEMDIALQAYNGKDVTTTDIRARELQQGRIIAFRPSDGTAIYPEPIPLRVRSTDPDSKSDGTINLLKTLDPTLDAVHGHWHQLDGPLKPVRENFARLQIPVDLPEAYTLEVRLRRISGDDVFGLGIVVGGEQTMLAIDSYGGDVLGIHRLDGKRANGNESTKKVTVFKDQQWSDLKCVVAPDGFTLSADGNVVLQWQGDPKRLSIDEKWSVPNQQWLFLATNDNVYEISKMTLLPN